MVRSNAPNSFEPLSAEPLLVVLIGPGGVGKGTLARRMVDADPQLWLSRSWTTRPRRDSEDGSEYHFVDRATFDEAIANELFLEWAEFNGHLYGSPVPQAPSNLDVLLEIEVQGAEQVRNKLPETVVFLIMPPSLEQLEERLRTRGDNEEHVKFRLSSTPSELAKGRALASYEVINDDLGTATSQILSILEELRQRRRAPSIKD